MTAAGAERPSPLALAVVSLLLGVAGASCADSIPTSPDPVRSESLTANSAQVSMQRGESSVFSGAAAQPSASFDLVAGTFTFTTASGDQLTGTYTGQAVVPASRPATASLNLRVLGGTGVFQGADGTLRGAGTGAFASEGDFSLSLKGSLSLATKPGVSHVQIDIVGTASLACVSGKVSVTLQGDGTSNRFGPVSGVLSHDVTNAGCES